MSASVVSLDWLAFTCKVPASDFASVFSSLSDFLGENIFSRGRGARGYSDSADILDGGFVAWSYNLPVNGVHVCLNSSSLALLKKYSVLEVFQFFEKLGGKCTRVDFAFDDFSGLLNLDLIAELLGLGSVVSRWKSFRIVRGSSEIGTSDFSGFTVYVGSRQSESFLRFYDKREEQISKGFEVEYPSWVRAEVEFKGDKAAKISQVCSEFDDSSGVVKYVSSLLFGLIDFKADFTPDCKVARLSTAAFWSDFLAGVVKSPLSLPQKVRTIETLKDWFDVSVAPSLAIVSELPGGEDWIFEKLKLGRKRWKRKHRDLYFGELDKGLDIRLSELGLQ